MATYDDTINKHKKNLRDAQIEALVEKAKQFSRENASVRSDAVRDAVEGYDTAYRNLQNLGLAGRQGTEMTGEVPRLKKKIEGEFNQTNARLIGNENNALDSIGASMAEQNKIRRVPTQQTIVPTQTTNSMLQRMLPTIKPGEDVSITGNVQGIQRMRVGQVALGDNPDNVNRRLAYNEAYKQYNRSVLERNAYNKSVENPVGEARLEGEAQKARAAMVALGIQPKSVNNRGEISSGILQQERQTDNAIRYEQYQDTMTQVKYGKDTATKRRALDSVAQQMVDTSTSFDVRYAMAVDYLQNSKITSKEADLAASRVIAEAYGVGYYSDEEIAYLEKKKKEAETAYVESGDGRTLDNAKNDLQEAKKVRNEFDAVANTLVRKVKGAKETPATIKAKKEAQEKYTKAKEGFDKARASKDSRAGSGVRKYADDMKALLSDDTIGLETRYEMAVDIVRTIDEGDAPELYAEAERIFGMYYGLPEQMSDANYNNLYNMYKMAGRKNPFGINNTEEKKAWEQAQTDRAQYEHYIAGLVNKEKYVGKKPTQPINEKEGNAYYAAVNGYLFDGFEDSQARIAEEKRYGRYKYMNQEERDAYNYLYETEGIEAANDFAKSLDGILDARRSAGLAKTAEDDAERGVFSNIASNALSVLVGLGEIQPAVERLGQGIYNELVGTGAPAYIDSNSSSYDVSNARSAIRSKTSELILGDNPTVWREVANFAYNTTMSMADSATMMPIHAAGLGWVTDLVFFSSASNDAYKDAVSRGATQSQAMGAAVLSGVAEALFEHVSLDQAIHMLKTGNLKYLRNILRQGFVEGSEEFFTELANTLTDKMFMQELSKNSLNRKKYISDGMSEKEADMQVFLDTLSNLGLATLGGFVSGGIFGTFGTVANRINNKNVGTSLQNNGAGNAIAENAKRIGGDAAILADEYTSKGKPLTAEQTGEIYNAMAEQIQESVKSEEDLSTLATIMDGKTVTDTQAEAMLGSSKELLDNAGFDTSSAEALKESFEQRNKEVTDFGNKARQDFYNDVSRKSVASVYRSTDIQDQAPALPTGLSGVALAEAQKQNFKAQSTIKSGRVELQLSMLKTNGGVSTTAQLNQVKSAMTKEAQRKLTAIERLSEALNMDVVVHDVMTGTNGFFGEDGKIHFTLSSKLSVPRVAAHELTHKMKTDARAQYDAVRDQIIQNAGQEEFDDLMAEKAKEYGFDLKNESQRELCDDEVVAELCEGMLSDSKKLSSFAERHLEAAKALKARLTKIIVAIKNALMGTDQFSDEMFVDQDVIDKWLEGLNAVIAQAEARQETLEGIIATEAGVTSEQQESLMRDVAEIHAEAQQKINETKAELQEKIAELDGEKSKEEQKEAERKAREAEEQRAKAEAERKAAEEAKAEEERRAREEAERKAAEEEESEEAREARYQEAWIEAGRKAEREARAEAKRKGEEYKSKPPLSEEDMRDFLKFRQDLVTASKGYFSMSEDPSKTAEAKQSYLELAELNLRVAYRVNDYIQNGATGDDISSIGPKIYYAVLGTNKRRKAFLKEFEEKQGGGIRGEALAFRMYLEWQQFEKVIAKEREARKEAADKKIGEAITQYSVDIIAYDLPGYKADLTAAGVMTAKSIDSLFKLMNKVIDKIRLDEKSRRILDFGTELTTEEEIQLAKETRAYSPYKSNADPHYKLALDFSTLCRKRILLQAIQERLQTKLRRSLEQEEIVAIRLELQKLQAEGMKIEVACALCYVEAARLKSPKVINEFLADPEKHMRNYMAQTNKSAKAEIKALQEQWKVDHGYEAKATKKVMSEADKKEYNKHFKELRQQYQQDAETEKIIADAVQAIRKTPASVLTASGLANLKKSVDSADNALYNAFIRKVTAATRSKAQETDVPYVRGDVLQVAQSLIDQMNEESGFRHQSWSDFQIIHLLDTMASIIELSQRKAKMHAYTKVPMFVELVGRTGMMINMSLIPAGDIGIDADGHLIFDPVGGMAFEDMLRLRDMFPNTAGNVAIGIDDRQIQIMLESDQIDYVIPYHVSGLNKKMRKYMDIQAWHEYTSSQNEKGNKRGKKGKAPALKEWFDEAEGVKAKDGYEYMRQASEKYLRLCYERNLTPKFSQYLNKNSDGSYSLKAEYANYWKLLIDRKMVNHKTGKIIAQKAVLPIFDSDFILGNDAKGITGILDQALADPAVQDVVTAENMVYEKFSNWDRDINNADAEAIAEAKRMRDLTAQVAVQKTVEAGKVKTQQINSVDNQTADIDSRFSIDHDLLRELDAYNARARLEGEIDVAMQAAKQVGKLETRLNKSLENQKKLRSEFNERLKTEKKTMKESFKAEKKKAVSDAELAGEIHVARQAAKQVGNLERKLQKSKEEIVGLKKKPKEAVAKERKRVAQNTAKKVIKRQIRTMDRIYAHPKAGMYVAQELLSDVKDFLIEMEMYTSGSEGSLKRIAKVEKAYEDLRPTNPNEMSDTAVRYDESVMRALKEVKEIMSVKNFKELTLEELLTVMNAVSGVSVSIKNAIEFVDRTKDMNIGDRADRLQNQALDNSKRFKWYKKHGSSLAIKALKSILSPERYARFVSGYASDSVLTEEMQYLNNGQNRVTEIQRDALRPYEAFMNEHGKEFVKWQGKDATWVDTGMADVDGNPVQITPAMRIALVLQTRNKQNMKHLLDGGFRMPNVNMYKNGKFSNMYDTGVRVIPTQEQLLALENGMSATEKLYMDLVAETFNEYLPSIINETSVKMVGFKLARVKNYFPIIVDSSYLNTNYGAAFARGDLQDSGWLQERKNSSKPVMLEDVNQTLERQIEGVSMYGGLAIPIANFERLINTGNFRIATVNGEETLIEHPVKDTLRQDIPYGMDFVRKLIEDLKGGSSNPRMVSQLFSKIQSAYIKSVLALNTTSFASQLSSYPATAAVVGWNNAAKALTSGKVDYDTIYKYSEVAWDRARGYSSPELKDYTESSKNWRLKYPKLTKAVWGWMNQGDKITVGLQWKAAEFWVQEHTDLKQGTEAYYVAVGKKLNEIVQTVQENSSVMQRGEILRNKKIGYQPFTLFKTQQFQIGGMVADSALELAIRDRSNMSQAEIKEMVDRCATRISLSLVLAASSSIARFLGNLVRGTLNGYRDDDDELTGESILLNMLDEFADGIVGMFPFAEEVKTLIVNNVILKEPRYDMNDVTTDVLNTFADLVTNLPKYLEKAFNPDLSSEERFANFKKAAKKIGSVIGQVTGIPVDNAWKILQGYHNMGNDAIDAIRYGSIDWFRHSSGQLDNKRTHTEYNTARKAGISGSDFFSWKKTLKGEASEKRKMLFDGEKDPKKAAVLDSLLIPSDSSTEQKVEGAVVLTRSIDKDGTPKKYSDGTEAQWVVKADYSNDDMFNISQYGDAKYTKAKEAMSNGAKSTNILGLYDAMAEYSEVNGTQMNAEEKRAWIRTNVKDTKQSAVLDAYIVCKTDSTNVRVIGNGRIVQTMKMENGEPKTYADGHVATWEIAADYSSDDMFKLSQRGESYYAKGVNALQNGADIKTVNRLLEANDAYMEANGNGMNTEEKRNWIYDNVENRSQAAVLDAYMVSNGNEVKVEGNIVSALFGNGEWNVVSDYSSETWYKLSQYGNDGNDSRYQKALTVSRKGGDATKVLKYYEYCDSQRDTPSYEERRDWIYKCGASASERAIMDAYLTRQDKDTEVMTKGGIVYTRSLGSNGKPKTYADGSKATWKVASDYTSKDWYEVSKTGYYDKARKAYESVGIRPSTFSTIYEAWSALSAKDANGRTVNGLKKRRTIEYLNTTNLTREQKQYFLTQVCGYK